MCISFLLRTQTPIWEGGSVCVTFAPSYTALSCVYYTATESKKVSRSASPDLFRCERQVPGCQWTSLGITHNGVLVELFYNSPAYMGGRPLDYNSTCTPRWLQIGWLIQSAPDSVEYLAMLSSDYVHLQGCVCDSLRFWYLFR